MSETPPASTNSAPRTIALVGLGNMGLGMASRLLEAGHRLHLYNRTGSRADELARRGAMRFDSPQAACEGADAAISMVADDVASRAVWLNPDGILAAGMAEHGFAIECSTLSHDWVTELATRCRARGLRYLDVGVVADAFLTSQAASPQVVRNLRRMVADDHDRDIVFSSALRLKDVEYAVRFARTLGIGSPFGVLAEGIYRQLCEMGFAQINESKVIEVSRAATMDARK